MNSLAWDDRADRDRPRAAPAARVAGEAAFWRGALILLLAMVFSGLVPFLHLYSVALNYGFYAALGGCALLCLFADRPAGANLRSVRPYLILVAVYFLWGTLVSTDKATVLPDVVRSVIYSTLILVAVAVGLADRRDWTRFAGVVQLATIGNCAFALYETTTPGLVQQLALALDPNALAFSETRPAGLWSNANEAAIAYLFALLLSFWTRGPLGWLGRAAAVVGILLTVSRAGTYIAVVLGALYLLYRLRGLRLSAAGIGLACIGLALGVGLTLWLAAGTTFVRDAGRVLDSPTAERLLDFSETGTAQASVDSGIRRSLATLAAQQALNGPLLGAGIFTFEGGTVGEQGFASILSLGTHDIYLAVWGEIGIFGLLFYLAVLGYGVRALLLARIRPHERAIGLLFWIAFLLVGLVWHNQFTSFAGMLYAGIVYHLPAMAAAGEV